MSVHVTYIWNDTCTCMLHVHKQTFFKKLKGLSTTYFFKQCFVINVSAEYKTTIALTRAWYHLILSVLWCTLSRYNNLLLIIILLFATTNLEMVWDAMRVSKDSSVDPPSSLSSVILTKGWFLGTISNDISASPFFRDSESCNNHSQILIKVFKV